MEIYNIALDGPSGSGKSTVAKALSQKLGILYLDTGAMYRATAVKALRLGVDPLDERAVAAAYVSGRRRRFEGDPRTAGLDGGV